MATMQEIADLIGVSRGTVDRVLNDRGGVNEATRKKVMDAAKLLNYQINKTGTALAMQQKKLTVGVVLFGIDNPFFDDVIQGIYNKAEELSVYGCSLIVKKIPFDVDAQIQAIDEMVAEGINGLLLSPYTDKRVREKINELHEKNIPIVTVNTDIPDSHRLAYVGSDDYKSGITAGGLMGLICHGETEIGIITGSRYVKGHEDRIHGFTDIARTKYPNLTIVALDGCDDDDYKSYNIVQRMLTEHPTISALCFAASGIYGGCKAIAQSMSHAPLKVIAFDQASTTIEFLNRGIITALVCQESFRQGSDALSILLEKLVYGTDPAKKLNYTDLVIKIKENI